MPRVLIYLGHAAVMVALMAGLLAAGHPWWACLAAFTAGAGAMEAWRSWRIYQREP